MHGLLGRIQRGFQETPLPKVWTGVLFRSCFQIGPAFLVDPDARLVRTRGEGVRWVLPRPSVIMNIRFWSLTFVYL